MKNHLLKQNLLYSLVTLILGILLVALDGSILVNILFIILGALIIVSNLTTFINSIKNLQYKTPVAYTQFVTSAIIMLSGILLIILRQSISAIIGIIILVFVAINLIVNRKYFKVYFVNQLPILICAVILLVFGFGGVLDLLCTVVGIIMIVMSIISFIGSLLIGR